VLGQFLDISWNPAILWDIYVPRMTVHWSLEPHTS